MDRNLTGRCILIVEDEPLVVLNIAHAFKGAGADVLTAATLREGHHLAEHPRLSAAIIAA
jgi:DNA-binding response OmpR family regulator